MPFNMGVGDKNAKIAYDENISSSAMGEGSDEGYIVKMDDHLKDEAVSFIKMDIEGAEIDALKGAEMLIKKQKPTLAICIYHRMSDLWNIPLLIRSFVPEYKLFIRHHTPLYLETVCYAVI